MKTKIVIFAILTLSILLSFCFAASADSEAFIPSGELITDRGAFLSDSTEAELSDALRDASAACGADIRVYTYRGWEYYDWENYIEESEDSFDSLVLLVIQYDVDYNFYYYLDTYGDAQCDITDKEVDRILDNPDVYNNIKSGDLKPGIIAYAELAATAVSGELRPNIAKVLTVSFIIAAIVATAVSLWIYFAYKKKLHSDSYPLEKYASLDLRVERDSFITKFVTRVRIRTSDGGGGRSGGRSGGGGSRRGGR